MDFMEMQRRNLAEANTRNRHNDTMRQMKNQNLSISQVAQSTSDLAQAQVQANSIQKETNDLLKIQCDQLSKRNEILEHELKNAQKQSKWSLAVNIITIFISLSSLVVAILSNFI